MAEARSPRVAEYLFGNFRLLPEQQLLLDGDVPVRLGSRAREILVTLVEGRGALISKEELIARVWPNTHIDENNLKVHLVAVRKALGDNADDSRYITNVPGKGYRFVAPVDTVEPALKHNFGFDSGHRAPAILTSIVGRSDDIMALENLLRKSRLVTIVGPGGIGKTRLALSVAQSVAATFEDGVRFVELSPIVDPTLLPTVLATALGVAVHSDNPIRNLNSFLKDKRVLIVLDSCEHLAKAAAATTEEIIRHSRGACILATSRESLRAIGERIYRLTPLPTPSPSVRTSVEHALSFPGVQLFVERTCASCAFELTEANVAAVVELCHRLDGIPLALEIAAGHVEAFGVTELAARLDDRLRLHIEGRRTALTRQRTLGATLDWSYQLLPHVQRIALQRLAIFVGSFTWEDAFSVVQLGDDDIPDIFGALIDLIDKSLVSTTSDRGRLRLLETTRAYAGLKLNETGKQMRMARRHAEHMRDALSVAEIEQRQRPLSQWVDAHRYMLGDVRAALEWAFSSSGDPNIATALALASLPFWFALAQIAQARAWSERALANAEAGSRGEMQIQMALGYAFWYSPDVASAERAFARAREIAERIGEASVLRQTLWGMWAIRRARGEYRSSLDLANGFKAAAESAGDLAAIHLGDRILGLTHHYLGDQKLARQFAEKALDRSRDMEAMPGIGYQVETPIAIGMLMSRILWLQGFPKQAADAAQKAIEAARRSGDTFSLYYVLIFAGLPLALWTNSLKEARRQLDIVVDCRAEMQMPDKENWVKCYENVMRLRQGGKRDVLAACFLEARLDMFSVSSLAKLSSEVDIPRPSSKIEPGEAAWNSAELLRVDAEFIQLEDVSDSATIAETYLLRSLDIAREQSALSWELRSAMSLARLWYEKGRSLDARILLSTTYDKFTEGFGVGDLINAQKLLALLDTF